MLGEGGTTTQVFGEYATRDTITLVDPTREGYTFTGWTCSDPLALSGNTLTIGTTDLTITANWVISQDSLNSLYLMLEQERARLDTYPVGSIYISTSSTNPGTIFGGTWERYGKGKTLVSLDEEDANFDTVNETGGEKTHTLTQNELPNYDIGNIPAPVPYYHTQYNNNGIYGSSLTKQTNVVTNTVGSTTINTTDSNAVQYGWRVNTNGGSQSHNNLQPYITTYMWKRTA